MKNEQPWYFILSENASLLLLDEFETYTYDNARFPVLGKMCKIIYVIVITCAFGFPVQRIKSSKKNGDWEFASTWDVLKIKIYYII